MPSPREIADVVTEAFNAHQLARVAQLYAPDVVLVTPDAGQLQGREQAAEYLRGFLQAFPDGRIEVVVKHESGHSTIDEWIFHGTHTGPLPLPSGETVPGTGRRVSVRGVDVMIHAADGIAAHRTYFDQVQFLTALGLS